MLSGGSILNRPIQTHSTERDGKRYIWYTERLWELAKDLPVYVAEVERFAELDRDCWFGEGRTPTIREVADHCRRINETDTRYPLIINDNGQLMDGGHRLARALLEGRKTVKAVRFEEMPEPDEIEEL
ncbi:MAG: chromosome partitioning protein ParB [Gemmatimonadetes bacterium]|nr:chromosome partitioning protein ParB [Gemmatimonadota bacterium]